MEREGTIRKLPIREDTLSDQRKAERSKRNLRRADLSRHNLSGANLVQANLRGANLTGANLFAANLSDANLNEAKLVDCKLRSAKIGEDSTHRSRLRNRRSFQRQSERGRPQFCQKPDRRTNHVRPDRQHHQTAQKPAKYSRKTSLAHPLANRQML